MRTTSLLAAVAIVSATLFTTWALYITVVEHPARLASGAAAARAQFRASYQRAAPWQAAFAAIALASGMAVAAATGRWPWLVGAAALGAVIPLTLVVIRPTNRRLLGAEALPDADVLSLLARWGRLHAVRTGLGALGVLAFLHAVKLR